ncbi:hypothetical protein BJ138DRAFT_1070614 [Hygrophoropsis aurantiaca]|uniref:Uncharacterized protein n=1 Tax=Hygrophoropsis aurantiaca TaxID=72124 RepID=A0ACB8A158_9AGAM|nr:hypothetical protein BJ138DRAFT_1070614 [Hygrophoropsis aurantiaca]
MHRALLIVEIQLYIFNEISKGQDSENPDDSYLEKHMLNALARTCKTFSEAALDVLWCDLDSFIRLIQCMPKDLRRRSGTSYSHIPGVLGRVPLTRTLGRSITPSDWAIFQKYSRRVHSLGPMTSILDDTFILALCSPSAPTLLLPNLVSLHLRVVSDNIFLLLPRICSPALISLKITFPRDWDSSQALESALPISFEICPSLKRLSVYVPVNASVTPNALEGLRRSISRLQKLDAVSWDNLGNEGILSLARLPALTKASFILAPGFPIYIKTLLSRSPVLKPAFSRVRSLSFSDCSFASATAFLNYFTVDLEELNIMIRSPSGSGTDTGATLILDFFAALGSSSPHDAPSLQDLTIYDCAPQLHSLGIRARELRPLLKFHRLQYLDLTLGGPIFINDATLLEMADAWPDLVLLFLNKDCGQQGSHGTPWGLAGLLERCSKLKRLSLRVDFSTIDRADFDPLGTAWHHSTGSDAHAGAQLEELFLGPFNITHPPAIARFLALILPNCLVFMRWPDDTGDEPSIYERRWREAEDLRLASLALWEEDLE